MKSSRRHGFTLIELLVVVAIIALLIAILLPSLGKAKMMANRTKCGTTLKSWGGAVANYQAENQGTFAARLGSGLGAQWDQDPKSRGIAITGTTTEGLYSRMAGSSLAGNLRFCPSDVGAPGLAGGPYYQNWPLPSYKFVWYANADASPITTSNSVRMQWRITQFKDTASKLLMCDSHSINNYGDFVTYIGVVGVTQSGSAPKNLVGNTSARGSADTRPYNTEQDLLDRHGGKGNVLFLDGHVENLPWSEWVNNIPATVADGEPHKKWTRMSN
jgi:prepilin-type N-terminal cleavage/methylation domain-containing protein/prepilin-type processing-associated H-X9-DG protein